MKNSIRLASATTHNNPNLKLSPGLKVGPPVSRVHVPHADEEGGADECPVVLPEPGAIAGTTTVPCMPSRDNCRAAAAGARTCNSGIAYQGGRLSAPASLDPERQTAEEGESHWRAARARC